VAEGAGQGQERGGTRYLRKGEFYKTESCAERRVLKRDEEQVVAAKDDRGSREESPST